MPRFLLQARPIKVPSWWPKIDGGWVSVDPDPDNSSSWSAGRFEKWAFPVKTTKRRRRAITHGDLMEAWLLDLEGEGWSFRMLLVEEKRAPRKPKRKTKAR